MPLAPDELFRLLRSDGTAALAPVGALGTSIDDVEDRA
jgi:hypothetical protein